MPWIRDELRRAVVPVLAVVTAFFLGAVVIVLTDFEHLRNIGTDPTRCDRRRARRRRRWLPSDVCRGDRRPGSRRPGDPEWQAHRHRSSYPAPLRDPHKRHAVHLRWPGSRCVVQGWPDQPRSGWAVHHGHRRRRDHGLARRWAAAVVPRPAGHTARRDDRRGRLRVHPRVPQGADGRARGDHDADAQRHRAEPRVPHLRRDRVLRASRAASRCASAHRPADDPRRLRLRRRGRDGRRRVVPAVPDDPRLRASSNRLQ